MGAADRRAPRGRVGWEAGQGRGPRNHMRVDRHRPPAPSTEARAAKARDLLQAALEDLSQEQLKRFRHKLRDAALDGRSIPWGRLERADAVDLAEQMIQFYGPEPALDVARKTLKRADVRDVAARLKEQGLQCERGLGGRRGPCLSVPFSPDRV